MADLSLSPRELNRATLARQGLLDRESHPVPSGVEQFGALQSQHPDWPPVALWTRLPNFQQARLDEAFASRAVVRAGLLRMTQHVVTAGDFWPMWAITQPFRLSQWRQMCRMDPLDPMLLRRLAGAHEAAMVALEERPLRREQFTEILRAHAPQDLQDLPWRGLSRHFMAVEPLVQVPEAGERYGHGRYTTARSWLGAAPREGDLDEARVTLLRRHLRAFGPATLDDSLAWIGRGRGGVTPWRAALARLEPEVVAISVDGEQFLDLADAPRPDANVEAPPRLLARWDSLLLAHTVPHRNRILPVEWHRQVNLKNADVLPTFLIDGFVAGTWDLSRQPDAARVELRPFLPVQRADRAALEAEAYDLLRFVAPDSATHEVGWGAR
jgi:hypothetical protein